MHYKKHIRFDWAIKRLLRRKANFGILEGFLSELLKEDIQIVEIIESESNQETQEDKYNRVDILVKDSKDELIIIEIQNSYALDYFLRILYGISKAIIEHMKEGDTYSKVKKIISVNIVYFELGHGEDYVYHGTTNFKGIHDNQILELTAAQKNLFKKEKIAEIYPEIYLIKVNKFNDKATDTLDEWIYFLKNSEIKQEFSAKGIKEADQVLKRANMSDEERREYQRFVEVLSDRASIAETIDFEAKLLAEKMAPEIAEKIAGKMAEEMAEQMAEEMAEQMAEEIAEQMAEEMAGKMANKLAEEKILESQNVSIRAMIKNTDMSDEDISKILNVEASRVAQLRKEIK